MVENKVLETIIRENLIAEGDKVILALSGGPDSVCLLNVLAKLKSQLNFQIYAAHLNHQIRGLEAHKDALYSIELCKKLGVPYFVKSLNVPEHAKLNKLTIEEAARNLRYDMLHELKQELNANKIAVAHNLDDQAETVLMRLLRGSGLNGLKAMDYKREDGIIRPLMDVQKKDIEIYCKEEDLNPQIDNTNLEDEYTRNKFRLHLIPYIEENFASNIKEILSRTANSLREDNYFIEDLALESYQKIATQLDRDTVKIELEDFDKLDPAIQKRIIRIAYKGVEGSLNGLETIHIQDCIDLICSSKANGKLNLPKGIIVQKKSVNIFVSKKELKYEPIEFSYTLKPGEKVIVKELDLEFEAKILSKEQCKYLTSGSMIKAFDAEKINGDIIIRTRQNGDKIKPLGLDGTKKLKDIFIDKKIPNEEKSKIPVICDQDKIIWVLGHTMSGETKIDDKTKQVIRISAKKLDVKKGRG